MHCLVLFLDILFPSWIWDRILRLSMTAAVLSMSGMRISVPRVIISDVLIFFFGKIDLLVYMTAFLFLSLICKFVTSQITHFANL